MRRWLFTMFVAASLSCGSAPPPKAPGEPATAASTAPFSEVATQTLDAYLELSPKRGAELGLHEYDGRLPDMTAKGLQDRQAKLETLLADLEPSKLGDLTASERVEHAALVTSLRGDLFALTELRSPWRNPMFYMDALSLSGYISRDYAPIEQRAKSIIAIARGTPAHLDAAKANLEEALPRTYVATALLQTRGNAEFVRTDVTNAMEGVTDPELKKELAAALDEMATALDHFGAFLESRNAKATDDFALGADKFSRMLRETQGFDVPLPQLQKVLEADLQANLEEMRKAAEQIAPGKPVAQTVATIAAEKPRDVLAEATSQAEDMRKFLIANKVVTIPTEDTAKVVESPPFMRWNAAFLDGAGVFETKKLPAFYYISPPDPAWPKEKQAAYVPGKTDLLFITIHEVWPGHFLHGLHVKVNESRILKSLWNYTTGEGWAHYTEQMMWDLGVSTDPRVRIGQLQNALLRNVRALSAIGLHTGAMTVEQSKQRFMAEAFQDEANAEQQAVRGTFDPMYLAYTVGKLAILKLRADVEAEAKAQGKPFDIGAFHDQLLAHGAAPMSAIRTSMLGPQAGPLL